MTRTIRLLVVATSLQLLGTSGCDSSSSTPAPAAPPPNAFANQIPSAAPPAAQAAPAVTPAAGATATGASPAQSAEQVLRAAADFYKGLKGFEARTTLLLNAVGAPNQNAPIETTLIAARPNLLAIRPSGAIPSHEVVCDGTKFYVSIPALQRYLESPAPPSFRELILSPTFQLVSPNGMANFGLQLMTDDPYATLMENVQSSAYAGTASIDGKQCDHLTFKQQQFDWDLWIDAGEQPLLRQTSVDLSKSLGPLAAQLGRGGPVKLNELYRDWKIDPTSTPTTFAFVPPQGATKVDNMFDLAGLGGAGGGAPQEPQSPLVGKAAASVELSMLDGTPFSLAADKGKNIVILDFWATWCGPCVREMPLVAQVAAEYKDKGVVVYAVNQREDAATIRQFLLREHLQVHVVLDSTGSVGNAYQVEGIPTLVVIDKEGIVQSVHVGFRPDITTQLKSELDTLLAGKRLAETAPTTAPAEPSSPLVGSPAAPITLDTLDGQPFTLAVQKGKGIVMLDFWATWCPPCVEEMPVLAELAAEYKEKGVALYAVNLQEDKDTVQQFLVEKKLDVQVLLDTQGTVASAYGVESIPMLVIVDNEGVVRHVHVGYNPNIRQQLQTELDALLAADTKQ